jgi:hypothetical protein
MNYKTPKTEVMADIIQLPSGCLVIRMRPGCKPPFTQLAQTEKQIDGSILFTPLDQEIDMADASKILGMPYSTLRRIIERGAIKAFKRSPGRWALSLVSVLQHKQNAAADPEYWQNLKAENTSLMKQIKPI